MTTTKANPVYKRKAREGADKEGSVAFGLRLQAAYKLSDHTIPEPFQFARKFNDTHLNKPITIHTADRWLRGAAMPTEEKRLRLQSG